MKVRATIAIQLQTGIDSRKISSCLRILAVTAYTSWRISRGVCGGIQNIFGPALTRASNSRYEAERNARHASRSSYSTVQGTRYENNFNSGRAPVPENTELVLGPFRVWRLWPLSGLSLKELLYTTSHFKLSRISKLFCCAIAKICTGCGASPTVTSVKGGTHFLSP